MVILPIFGDKRIYIFAIDGARLIIKSCRALKTLLITPLASRRELVARCMKLDKLVNGFALASFLMRPGLTCCYMQDFPGRRRV